MPSEHAVGPGTHSQNFLVMRGFCPLSGYRATPGPADRFLSGGRGRDHTLPGQWDKFQHPLVNFLVGTAIHTFLGQSSGFQHPLMDFPVVTHQALQNNGMMWSYGRSQVADLLHTFCG